MGRHGDGCHTPPVAKCQWPGRVVTVVTVWPCDCVAVWAWVCVTVWAWVGVCGRGCHWQCVCQWPGRVVTVWPGVCAIAVCAIAQCAVQYVVIQPRVCVCTRTHTQSTPRLLSTHVWVHYVRNKNQLVG